MTSGMSSFALHWLGGPSSHQEVPSLNHAMSFIWENLFWRSMTGAFFRQGQGERSCWEWGRVVSPWSVVWCRGSGGPEKPDGFVLFLWWAWPATDEVTGKYSTERRKKGGDTMWERKKAFRQFTVQRLTERTWNYFLGGGFVPLRGPWKTLVVWL